MTFFYAFLLVVVLLIGCLLTLLGMPGNWLMVAATAVYAFLVPAESAGSIGWGVVAALVILALLGELLEFLAGALGVAKAGGSKRGAALALLGSLVGGVLGIFVGLPVPVVGPILAALLFASLGALLGAIVGEQWKGRDLAASWQIGKGAFWGRLLGTLAKTVIASVIAVVALAALVL